jgi:hypothetical protein
MMKNNSSNNSCKNYSYEGLDQLLQKANRLHDQAVFDVLCAGVKKLCTLFRRRFPFSTHESDVEYQEKLPLSDGR